MSNLTCGDSHGTGASMAGEPADALRRAAGAVCDHVASASYARVLAPAQLDDPLPTKADPESNSLLVKEAARQLGAVLVGICRFEERHRHSRGPLADVPDLPARYPWAVVMAVPMDAASILASPARLASAATRIGYLRMAVSAVALGRFIAELGYSAVPCGNDTAGSIGLARDAGLGEVGRHGLLITQEFGSCVRLCKVFTDMDLKPDSVTDFGARARCETCTRCVLACPAGAIGPIGKLADGVKCREFWERNGTSCCSCIAACPFTPSISVDPT